MLCVKGRRSKRKTEIWRLREGRAKWEGGLLSVTFTCPRIQIPTIYQAGSRRVQRIEGTVLKVSAFRGAFRWMVVKVFLPLRLLHRRPSSLKFVYALGAR